MGVTVGQHVKLTPRTKKTLVLRCHHFVQPTRKRRLPDLVKPRSSVSPADCLEHSATRAVGLDATTWEAPKEVAGSLHQKERQAVAV